MSNEPEPNPYDKSPRYLGYITRRDLEERATFTLRSERERYIPGKNSRAMALDQERVQQFAWCDDCGSLAQGFASCDHTNSDGQPTRWRRCNNCYRAYRRRVEGKVGRAPRVLY